MGFHGKDDYESIERRQEWKAQEPLRGKIAAMQKRIDNLKAQNTRLRQEIADLKDPHVQEARRIGDL